MTTEIANTYSTQIISIIDALEKQLKDITQSQNELIEAISKAQTTSVTEQELTDIKKMMDKVSLYNTKLLSLKATMSMLTGRSKQLQGKADKLKQMKIQYLSQIDKIRKMEQEKDQTIAAKTSIMISTPSTSTSSPQILSPSSTMSSSMMMTTNSNDITPIGSNTPTESISTTHTTTTVTIAAIPKIKSIAKKKKKTRAREALIGDDSSPSESWVPKRSISQKDLLKKP